MLQTRCKASFIAPHVIEEFFNALLTSQIKSSPATLTDLFDEEAGFKVSNTDDVEEVTNYLRAFR